MSANTLCWTDIPVVKLDRAIKFYAAVLGAKVKKESMPGFEFGVLPHHDNNVSGCLCKIKGNKPSKTGPLIYLSVGKRHNLAEKAVVKNGGKVLQKKHPIGPYGFRSVIVDSEGNRLALHSK
jgi:predicted enzyme related to lactoylglutathione lyase